MLDHQLTRVELLDRDDPAGIERADDHAIGKSMIISLLAFGAIALVAHDTVDWAGPALVAMWTGLWLRSTRSGIGSPALAYTR